MSWLDVARRGLVIVVLGGTSHDQTFLRLADEADAVHPWFVRTRRKVVFGRGAASGLLFAACRVVAVQLTPKALTLLEHCTASIVMPNVRAKRATTAGRQARAGENVPRTARPGLVACRWRSA